MATTEPRSPAELQRGWVVGSPCGHAGPGRRRGTAGAWMIPGPLGGRLTHRASPPPIEVWPGTVAKWFVEDRDQATAPRTLPPSPRSNQRH